jgi:hypothetical protein
MTPSAEHLITRAAGTMGTAHDYVRAVALSPGFALEQRAAVTANDTSVLAGRPGYKELLGLVERDSVLANIGGVEVPFGATAAVATTLPEPVWVGRGSTKPATAAPFVSLRLDPRTVACLLVASKETIRASGVRADAALSRLLTQAAVSALNTALLSDDEEVEDLSPAGLAFGLTPVTLLGLDDADIFEASLALLDGLVRPTLVGSLAAVLRIRAALGAGGELVNVVVAPEAGSRVFAIEAGAVAYSFDGIDVQTSESATLQMSDSPTDNPATGVSMFQTNNVALRVDARANWSVVGTVRVLSMAMDVGSS